MKAIYSADTNSIQKPDSVNLDTGKAFRGESIPCSEECRTTFKDGQLLTEGVEYEVQEQNAFFAILGDGKSMPLAIPIKQDNTNEDEQLESWRDIWEIGQRIRDKSNMIDAWTEKYTITKRKP